MSPDVEACATHTEAMHSMDILGFVEAQKIPSEYFATPYRLLPAPGGEHLYALLCEELQRRGKIGIAHVELQSRPQLAALVPQGRSLMLTTLNWANEADRPAPSIDDLLLPAGAEAASYACCAADGIVADAGLQPLQPEMPALAEYAMTDRDSAEFSLEEPDELAEDEDCFEDRYLGSAMRRARHPRDGYAMRGGRPRGRRMLAARSRSARRR